MVSKAGLFWHQIIRVIALSKGKAMKHPVDVHVGKRIRHRRWIAGTTQQQLAESVGIKFQQIQKYETGMNRVSASRLWDIAHALGVSVSFFFEGLDTASDAKPTESSDMPGDILSDREALELLRSYYAIPENQRRRLFDLARVLSEAA
jgi:transcriptional regulator with XRE-family HTH domain